MSSLEKPKIQSETAKPKAVRKPRTKKSDIKQKATGKNIKQKASVVKQKTGKVEQSVVVNVSTSKGKGRGRKPKVAPPADNIAQRQPLTNNVINAIPADKNITPDPIKYLETKEVKPTTKVGVKLKKGQNKYNVETELQQEAFEVKPNAKGKGLAENVEQQTELKIQVDKKPRGKTKLNLDPVQQFVDTYGGNTDKVKAFDEEAEGTFEKNAEEGMEIKTPKVRKPRQSKQVKEELAQRGISTREGYSFGKAIGIIEGEEDTIQLLKPRGLSKSAEKYLESIKTHREQAKKVSSLLPESEPFTATKKKDSSLSKLYENQFDADVNYLNQTNNSDTGRNVLPNTTDFPDSNNALSYAGQDINYVFA